MMITVFEQNVEIPDELWNEYMEYFQESNVEELTGRIQTDADTDGNLCMQVESCIKFYIWEKAHSFYRPNETADRNTPVLENIQKGDTVNVTIFSKPCQIPYDRVEEYERVTGRSVNLVRLEGFVISERLSPKKFTEISGEDLTGIISKAMWEEMGCYREQEAEVFGGC